MTWLHNDKVAWQIPSEHRIDWMYETGAYLPPDGWKVDWKVPFKLYDLGVCGELRNKESKEKQNG